MAENSRPIAEPLQKGAQAAHFVRGAVKTGKAIAGAAKGAAAGGVWGAVAGFAWENRKFLTKVLIAATALLMIPIIILCMLPSVIFGGFGSSHSPADPSTPIMNSSVAIDTNLTEISTAVSTVLSEGMAGTLQAIENDYATCTADGMEIINPHESSPNFNANLFVGQYCAAKSEDYTTISVSDMENMLRQGIDKLYSYTKKEEERLVETVTVTVTVDATTGEETEVETVTTTVENWIVYTVSYNGEAYFADEVFHLTAEQKELADDYAYNLSLFLGDSMFQGLPDGYTTITSLGNVRFTDGQTEVVYFNQLDERYANQPYGTDHIGGYGCGPTAMSIVVSSLTNETVDPIQMARWSYEMATGAQKVALITPLYLLPLKRGDYRWKVALHQKAKESLTLWQTVSWWWQLCSKGISPIPVTLSYCAALRTERFSLQIRQAMTAAVWNGICRSF